MSSKLVLIHTVPPLIGTFTSLGAELLPDVQQLHVLDEVILERVRQRGRLDPQDAERLRAHVVSAEEIGAAAVLVTCSTISPCVDEVRPRVGIPVIKIDEAMVARAVDSGTRIGLVAPNPATIEPSSQLLRVRAAQLGKPIEVHARLAEGAFAAVLSGDGATHDRLVRDAVLDLAPSVDVIVLAQASMARVLATLPEHERPVPILSSPHMALDQVRQAIDDTKLA